MKKLSGEYDLGIFFARGLGTTTKESSDFCSQEEKSERLLEGKNIELFSIAKIFKESSF